MSATVVLYSTSVPTLPKVRADIATIKRILEAKKVSYVEVSEVAGAAANALPGRWEVGGVTPFHPHLTAVSDSPRFVA
jgi:hypothetical protein